MYPPKTKTSGLPRIPLPFFFVLLGDIPCFLTNLGIALAGDQIAFAGTGRRCCSVLLRWTYEDSWEERELEDPEDLGGVPLIRECENRKKKVGLWC